MTARALLVCILAALAAYVLMKMVPEGFTTKAPRAAAVAGGRPPAGAKVSRLEDAVMARKISGGVPALDETRIDQDETENKRAKAYAKLVKKGADPAKSVSFQRLLATHARAHAQSSLHFAAKIVMRVDSRPEIKQTAVGVRQAFDACAAAEARALKARDPAEAAAAARDAAAARWRTQDALLLTMADTDPVRSSQLPARETAVVDTAWYAEGEMQVDAARKLLPSQAKLLKFLELKGQELLAHLLTKYPRNWRTKALNTHWTRRVLPVPEAIEAKGTGWAVTVGVSYCRVVAFNMLTAGSVPRSLTRLVHELCHIAGDPDGREDHTARFYETERWLLRIVTEELGWTVENWCRETCFMKEDKLQKDPELACPKCTWQQQPLLCRVALKTCAPGKDDAPESKKIPLPTTKDVPALKREAASNLSKLNLSMQLLKVADSQKLLTPATTADTILQFRRAKAALARLPAASRVQDVYVNHSIVVNATRALESIIQRTPEVAIAAPKPTASPTPSFQPARTPDTLNNTIVNTNTAVNTAVTGVTNLGATTTAPPQVVAAPVPLPTPTSIPM